MMQNAIPSTILKPRILVILLVGVIIGAVAGVIYQSDKDQAVLKNEIGGRDSQINTLTRQLKEKEEDLQLANEDRGKLVKEDKASYNFSKFGIYSSELESKEVIENTFNYKGRIINERSVYLSDPESSVRVWEFASSNQTSGNYNLYFTSNPNTFVIFGGYENYAIYPETMQQVVANWKDSYINSNEMKMYWTYNYAPRQIGSVTLNYYQGYSPMGHPILLQLTVYTAGLADKSTDPVVTQAKEKLKKLANLIKERP